MLLKTLKSILTTSIVTYGLAVILIYCIGNYKKACIQRLNVFHTSISEYPMLLDHKSAPFNEINLRESLHYYKILSETFPQLDQSYNMIAYCYSIEGNKKLAIKYYLEAKKLRPDRFWYDYNLGVVYSDLGEKQKANAYFRNIIQGDIQKLIEASILAPLSKLTLQERQEFYTNAVNFVYQIKDYSLRNIIKTYFNDQKYQETVTLSLYASQDNNLKNKTTYLLYAGVAAYKANQKEMALKIFKSILDREPDQKWAQIFFVLIKMNLEGVNTDKHTDDILKPFLNDPLLFPPELQKVMLHPWSYSITPGKEIYF